MVVLRSVPGSFSARLRRCVLRGLRVAGALDPYVLILPIEYPPGVSLLRPDASNAHVAIKNLPCSPMYIISTGSGALSHSHDP
jgi:hypothetical protein